MNIVLNFSLTALVASGLETDHFYFHGFLASKESQRENELKEMINRKETLIFYESPHRLENTLKNMLEVLGNRKISISREISKIHEEIYRDYIENLIPIASSLKGEFVLIVDGNHEKVDYSDMTIIEHVNIYLEDGISEKDAIKLVAKERNVAKSIIYKEYHNGK